MRVWSGPRRNTHIVRGCRDLARSRRADCNLLKFGHLSRAKAVLGTRRQDNVPPTHFKSSSLFVSLCLTSPRGFFSSQGFIFERTHFVNVFYIVQKEIPICCGSTLWVLQEVNTECLRANGHANSQSPWASSSEVPLSRAWLLLWPQTCYLSVTFQNSFHCF